MASIAEVNGGVFSLDGEVLADVNRLAVVLFIVANFNFGLILRLNFNLFGCNSPPLAAALSRMLG